VDADNDVAVLMIGRPYHLDPGLHHGIPDELQVLGYPILSIRSIPKDREWLDRFFKEDLDSGKIDHPLSIDDVWPENYSSNSAMKVWAAKFAARHPNVVLLDLSSFKCGHDAPTYGIIDRIVEKAAVPHSALHDIDANKPGGSIKIRVKTFSHSLQLYRERLEDIAAKRAELMRKVEEKRLELLRLKQASLAERAIRDDSVEEEIRRVSERLAEYRAIERRPQDEEHARVQTSGLIAIGRKTKTGGVAPLSLS